MVSWQCCDRHAETGRAHGLLFSQGGRNCIHIAAAEGNVEVMKIIHTVEGGLDLELTTKVCSKHRATVQPVGTHACFVPSPGIPHSTVLLPTAS